MDKRIEKLKNLTIKKNELETLLGKLGFSYRTHGSHKIWFKPGCAIITIASHNKEVAKYQLRQAVEILTKAGLI